MSGTRKGLAYLTIGFILFLTAGLHVWASEEKDSTLGTLQVLTADVEVKESADTASATVGSLQAGTAVIVVSEDDTWSQVIYQELEGYVPNSVLELYVYEDAESLEQEIRSVTQEEQRVVEEYEQNRKDRRNSLIWGIVIAVVVLGMFATGVVSALQDNKKEKEQNNKSGS